MLTIVLQARRCVAAAVVSDGEAGTLVFSATTAATISVEAVDVAGTATLLAATTTIVVEGAHRTILPVIVVGISTDTPG
jgi:hypothetical protein